MKRAGSSRRKRCTSSTISAAENEKKLATAPGIHRIANKLEVDILQKLRPVADEWRRVESKVDADVKESHITSAFERLADFRDANEGTDEAVKAAERADSLCAGTVANAEKLASVGNFKDARSLLTVSSKLSDKHEAAFKTALVNLDERIKLHQELVECYEHAVQKALYFDPISRTRFLFLDGAKYCADFATKTHNEANKKDLLELAELFKSADHISGSLRTQLAAHPVELTNLGGYSKVKVTSWDDKGLTYIPDRINQPQPFSWERASAPDTLFLVSKELKKSEMEKPACQWDLGILALAMGNQNYAGKLIREAVAREESPPRPKVALALKLLKPADASVVKTETPEAPMPQPCRFT